MDGSEKKWDVQWVGCGWIEGGMFMFSRGDVNMFNRKLGRCSIGSWGGGFNREEGCSIGS